MSEHLPQCHMRHGLPASAPCMCEMISAYKKRLRAPEEAAYQKGYAAALTAARDAVAALALTTVVLDGPLPVVHNVRVSDALAAIDNLITKNSGENYE